MAKNTGFSTAFFNLSSLAEQYALAFISGNEDKARYLKRCINLAATEIICRTFKIALPLIMYPALWAKQEIKGTRIILPISGPGRIYPPSSGPAVEFQINYQTSTVFVARRSGIRRVTLNAEFVQPSTTLSGYLLDVSEELDNVKSTVQNGQKQKSARKVLNRSLLYANGSIKGSTGPLAFKMNAISVPQLVGWMLKGQHARFS